jgi:hypothetical protein
MEKSAETPILPIENVFKQTNTMYVYRHNLRLCNIMFVLWTFINFATVGLCLD